MYMLHNSFTVSFFTEHFVYAENWKFDNPILHSCSVRCSLLAPLDSEDKPLTRAELVLYRQKTRAIDITIVIISIVGLCLHLPAILHAASISMALECVLLVLGKVKIIT